MSDPIEALCLERAAVAAGIVVVRNRLSDPLCQDFLIQAPPGGMQRLVPWNPWRRNGDALALAAKLKLDVCWNENDGPDVWHVNAWPQGNGLGAEEPPGDDAEGAMRRAITRAAAGTAT